MTKAIIRSYNLPSRVGGEAIVTKEMNSVIRGSAINLFQEGRHMGNNLRSLPRTKGFYFNLSENLPIVWDAKVAEITGAIEMRAFDATKVGGWGAGPGIMDEGWNSGVRLDFKTGGDLVVVNAHLVPSVVQTEKQVRASAKREKIDPDEAVRGWEKRRELHELEIAQLIAMTAGFPRVVIGGDFNSGPTYPGLKPLKAAGFKDVQPGPSLGPRGRIDHFFIKGVKKVNSRLMPKKRSDHRPIEITVEF